MLLARATKSAPAARPGSPRGRGPALPGAQVRERVVTLVRLIGTACEPDQCAEASRCTVDRTVLLREHRAEELATAFDPAADSGVDHDGHRRGGAVQVR